MHLALTENGSWLVLCTLCPKTQPWFIQWLNATLMHHAPGAATSFTVRPKYKSGFGHVLNSVTPWTLDPELRSWELCDGALIKQWCHFPPRWGDNTGSLFCLTCPWSCLWYEEALAMHQWGRNALLCSECVITWSCLIVWVDTIHLTADVLLFTQASWPQRQQGMCTHCTNSFQRPTCSSPRDLTPALI